MSDDHQATYEAVHQSAARICAFLPKLAAPRVALVLGSGLGSYADELSDAQGIDYGDIGFPRSGVSGHAGRLVYGRAGKTASHPGVEVLLMQGRVHTYEGHSLQTVVLPVRALVAAGCKTVVLTNAAGGVGDGLQAGDLVLIRDHLNLMGDSPLRGPNDERLGVRFPDMSEVYDAKLRSIALGVAAQLGIRMPTGVYAGLLGPQYETPSEVRMLRGLGADLVGMSTVPEAIVARHMGARVLGMSCVSNLAAGISPHPLSHEEVTETATRVRGTFIRLLDGIMAALAAVD
jgi:purine-nucleoside phosphorylase